MAARPTSVSAVARHLLSHPDESSYAAAKHLSIPTASATRAVNWLERNGVSAEAERLRFLIANPIPSKQFHFRVPDAAAWLAAPPAPLSVSGEDAAAVEGLDLIPHRHLLYVAPKDLERTVESLRAADADFADPDVANVTLRVRDPWLMDEPAPLVERGQRLLDYRESRHPVVARSVDLGA